MWGADRLMASSKVGQDAMQSQRACAQGRHRGAAGRKGEACGLGVVAGRWWSGDGGLALWRWCQVRAC